jgi:predicted exporter
LLALVTTVIGYSSLAQAPLPGLRQIAVFSVAGLVSAWLFVVVIYPLTAAPLARSYPPQLLALAALPWNAWQRLNRRQTIALISLLSSVCLGICLLALQSADDARALYRPSPTLLAQERQLQALAPGYSPNQFFLITGADIEAVLQREERLQVVLDQLRKDGAISQWNGVSRYLPSVARQQRNYQLLQRHVYGESGAAWPLMASLGLDAASQTELRQAFVTARGRYLLAEDWLPGAGAELKLLWLGRRNGRYASMVTLRGVADLAALNSAAEQIEGVVFVDRVAQISALLSTQRDAAGILLGLAYGCVMLLLLLVYRHPSALILALIPLLATLISVSMLALTGVPLSIFHVFALFLVLGLGMDYSIFARQGAPRDSDCRLAILLSALTSCLSFGLLALSSTPMVQAFGSTVLMGSMLNLLLVPLVDTLRGSGTP